MSTKTAQALMTNLSGVFLYQSKIEFYLGYYENTLVEVGPNILINSVSDAEGKFNIEFDLSKPRIIIFSSLHDDMRVYIQPGDSIHMRIVNRQNVVFSGDHAEENNLLFSEGLTSDIFRSPAIPDNSVEEKVDRILNTYQRRKDHLFIAKYDADFLLFYQAEIVGRKYTELNAAIGKDGAVHFPDFYAMVEEFGRENLIDESRSRSYNNCFALLRKVLLSQRDTAHVENKSITWYRSISSNERKVFLDIVRGYRNLYTLISYSQMNSLIYITDLDTAQLKLLDPILNKLKKEIPNGVLEAILDEALYEKVKKTKLVIPYLFSGKKPDSSYFKLDILRSPFVLIDFWATWCKPCLASMPKVDQFAADHADRVIVVAVNIGDTHANWTQWLEENHYPNLLHVKLSRDESKKVFQEYYFNSVPNYILLNEDFQFLINGTKSFDPNQLHYLLK